MRISDWSSDVCSSDLRILSRDDHGALAEAQPQQQRAVLLEPPGHRALVDDLLDRLAILFAVFVARVAVVRIMRQRDLVIEADEKEAEIGRASCRERVC